MYEDNSDMDKDYVEELNDDESDMSSPDETSDNDENENLRTETKIDGNKQRKTQFLTMFKLLFVITSNLCDGYQYMV